jgi:PfaB family protein
MQMKPVINPKLAIVGMDICLNSCESLAAFERSIYEGKSQLQVDTSDLDQRAFSTSSQVKSIFQVASNALQDAHINTGAKIIVIVATEQNSIANSIINQIDDYGNRINIRDRFDTIFVAQENSVFKAIENAQNLLVSQDIDAVLIIANTDNETAGAIVLKLAETAQQSENRIYAIIAEVASSSESIEQACQQAFERSRIGAEAIGYLDMCASPIASQENAEIRSAIAAYQNANTSFSCAFGKVANLGVVSQITSIIKTALCLYYRYIPAFPDWSTPEDLKLWQDSPFYITPQSKPWFLEAEATERFAGVSSSNYDGTYTHSILVEDTKRQECQSSYIGQTPVYLFPLAASDRDSLLQQLRTLQESITESDSLPSVAKQTFISYQKNSNCPYTVAILGKNKQELLREIDRALFKGIDQAFETGQDWQTPVGSYFTVNPQGKKGQVAYVYPGAYNAHLGLGRNLFRLFPKLFDDLIVQTTRNRLAKLEKLLYPRSWSKLSRRQLEAREKQLMEDALAMLESETGFAGLMTAVLRDYFRVKPQGILGYSLGEISAMYAQGVWTDVGQSSDKLNASSLFKDRLAGAKNAVREYWQLPPTKEEEDIWGTYVLMTSAIAVKEKIKHTNQVYLTQISTPKEVVIAGDPQACQQLIKELKCDSFRAPFNHAIHCEAMASEYNELVRLNTFPLQTHPAIKFYSAAQYKPIKYDSQAIAQNLSQTLCQQLDFPRLVNQVYQDDCRIFIEVGAGSNCSRWIGEILKSQEHLTVSVHRRGIDDQVSLVKALAKLVSHRVDLDLSPLYGQVQTNSLQTSLPKPEKYSPLPKAAVENSSVFHQQLTAYNSNLLKIHTNFLQSRQASLNYSSELMMLQFALLQRQYIQE